MGCFAMVCGKEQQKCHKETRIKREGKFGEKHKLGFLSSGMLNTGWGALLELVQDEPPALQPQAPSTDESPKLVAREGNGNTHPNSFQTVVRAKSCALWKRDKYLCAHLQMSPYRDSKCLIYLLFLPAALKSGVWGDRVREREQQDRVQPTTRSQNYLGDGDRKKTEHSTLAFMVKKTSHADFLAPALNTLTCWRP